ncbi:MAG: hypothetical protein E7649_02860 [Ruminococcaceae bacterium]|nr:hypothetical protein [Oscillospiraceae bacterium]
MKKKEWNEGMNHLDPDLVEKHIEQKERLRRKKQRARGIWIRFGAIAACFVLIVSVIIVSPMLRGDDPGIGTPPDGTGDDVGVKPEPGTTDDNNRPDIPSWNTAQYSAEDIAKIFDSMKFDGVATNAYTKIYAPSSKYLCIGKMTDDEYLRIYQHTQIDNKLDEVELKTFIDAFLPKLAESLDAPVPQYSIKEKNYSTGNTLSTGVYVGSYYLSASQNSQRNSLGLHKSKGDRQIVIDGETIQIDQRLSDEEILDSILSIKNKLFGIFGISFSNAKVVRRFGSYTKHGAEHVDIYFYDESAHELNSSQTKPITDYMCISFDNFINYSGDIVSDSILTVSSVYCYKNRSGISDNQYDVVANAKRISISEAEALLYNGYVFGGHSCPLCMSAQDKIDFEGYDFVDIEYVFEYSNENGTPSIGIPFYAFYKNIGISENGNTIYAKTYVPAIEVSGYKEYFESQKDYHQNDWDVDEVG